MSISARSQPSSREAAPQAVVIGVSAGGLNALSAILPQLPADYPLPVMIVIHLPPDRNSVVAELFDEKCALTVREAEDKEDILPGHVYFAPPDYHLLVEADHRLSLSSEEPVLFSRPSVDVLFETAADVYGEGLIGVILTGANPDGAAGLKAVMAAGGRGLVQRPDLSYASAMPEAALEFSPQAEALSLEQIAEKLREAVSI
ncbi:chemotaxis protein CheB [Asticcacaulis taihuensis]|uniref:protein-glutamate methylesterase n=1 Tax=Asticcacaulis taihuensis TaxID=260084 RepID=A0A1G4SUB7_9CAUL|nr:chemotaxis protein CheB [Asticcacaulis taihuensis]SCW72666.1 two-component system, chemotaxis family, response regulator CheB [Asticcacaulis taihuensis]